MSELAVSVRLTKVAVNCGDHAQDVTIVTEVAPEETLVDAARRLLGQPRWRGPEFEFDWYLTIQLVQPIPEPEAVPHD